MAGREEMLEEESSWRKQVDSNLKRLHSLVFASDFALQNRDFTSAQILSLRLIGFLDSRVQNDVDDSFILPIRRQAFSNLLAARTELLPNSDCQAFEQAGKSAGKVFGKQEDIDINKIMQSKYFQVIMHKSKGKSSKELGNQLDREDNLSGKTSKVLIQKNLNAFYGNFSSANAISSKGSVTCNNSNSDDCIVVEKVPLHHIHSRGRGTSKAEEEEKANGRSLVGSKRAYIETRSTRNETATSPSCNGEGDADISGNGFVTARAKLEMDARQRRGLGGMQSPTVSPQSDNNRGFGHRSYGYTRRGIRGNFVPPIRSKEGGAGNMTSRIARPAGKGDDALDDSTKRCLDMLCGPDGELPEKLRNLEPRLIEHISNEIMDQDPNVRWEDIAGLDHAKTCVTEMVIWPLLRPDIFKGCRSPGRGLLLFGPPGTGKTMIGKAIAGEAKATFFYISASSLTSKWIGEGEKLVRALFGVASCRQPAVIFVDEIDSLLSQRKSEGEHESSRRLKTQFLIEMEGFDSGSDQVLLIGATNRPQELDEAARRRLTKRLYIPLPSSDARAWIIRSLLQKDGLFKLSEEDTNTICKLTAGYSGSDMKNLVKDASMGPLREALRQGVEITKLNKEDMRPVTLQDFESALQEVRPSVSLNELGIYEDWNKQFGSLSL
ncbi:Fidgetin-like protein 1 [Heracleum sosnowskyi]|uniref:Fidgetin-like protein 1 n=1 Tax=Heracleum sosnowskyi TaxID=360622 RepID=A0AAD8HN77_9APIA|nr:Fidgetin-like protein 1 [Heracleum sosnowskyi]